MEKYPYLNEAIAHVLSRRRAELAMSKKKLSEEAMIARIHITALEAGHAVSFHERSVLPQ